MSSILCINMQKNSGKYLKKVFLCIFKNPTEFLEMHKSIQTLSTVEAIISTESESAAENYHDAHIS